MKPLYLAFALLIFAPAALACDEQCKRERAEAEHGVTFPAHLNQRFCEDTRTDFLLRARKSLQEYYDSRLPNGHRGGMRNIRNFIEQRKGWLEECDEYLQLTGQGRIFRTDETTEAIFAAIEDVSDELEYLVFHSGARGTYVEEGATESAIEHFNQMFGLVDAHTTELQLRGQLVIR